MQAEIDTLRAAGWKTAAERDRLREANAALIEENQRLRDAICAKAATNPARMSCDKYYRNAGVEVTDCRHDL